MAEKTTTKKAAAPKKAAAEKKVAAPKAAATKVAAEKKVCAKKATVKAPAYYVTAENAGFRAGDVYQTLAKAGSALSIAEIAKQANITAEDVLLGIGWLFKEGKVAEAANNTVVLA